MQNPQVLPSAALTRDQFVAHLLAAAATDARIVGVLDYGSTSEHRGDQWSDVDLVLFLRAADSAAFEREWETWLGQFGPVLLAYICGLGKPWAVLDALPLPLRVDFNFYPDTELDRILEWPCAPASVAAMVLYDATGGAITGRVSQIVRQALGPADPAVAFTQVSGDFWYYALRTWVKVLRGQRLVAQHEFTAIMLANLAALLRLEAGATERWRNSSAVQGIEQAVSTARAAAFAECFVRGEADIERAFVAAVRLAQSACQSIASRHGWLWPTELAAQVVALEMRL
jgi:hypothetical protein